MQIISSSNDPGEGIGICGTCLLQAYQIIAEIMQNPNSPRSGGGYFFDTAPNADPFVSFRARNSILYDTFSDISGYYALPVARPSDIFASSINMAYAASVSMLPQYDW